MNTPGILIACSSDSFLLDLKKMLSDAFFVRICHDGTKAAQALPSFRPQILIADLILPGTDGLTLIQQALQFSPPPATILIADFFSSYALDAAQRLDISLLLRKPCSPESVATRIRDLHRPSAVSAQEARIRLTNRLLSLGIPTKLGGFHYLLEIIPAYAANPNQLITKELYPSTGRDPRPVERAIRSAIEAAWAQRDDVVWSRYFPPDSTGFIRRPTNAEFISRLAQTLPEPAPTPQRTSTP